MKNLRKKDTTAMDGSKQPPAVQHLTEIFETIEYPEAFRITYMANAIVFPAYAAVKRDFGLVRAEYVLLACLSHFDELTAQDVARISRQPRNTISRAVHRMLEEGYLRRAPDPEDGRQARLRITDKGRDLHTKIAEMHQKRQNEVLGGLNEEERATLSALLQKAVLHAATLKD